MNDAIVKLEEAVKIYKRGGEEIRALNGINLEIEKGDFLAIVGPSGSGKTTLLNIIGCVDRLTSGRILINGKDVTNEKNTLTEIRRHLVGFVFQQFFLIPTLTALENIQIPGLFSRNPKRKKRAEELLKLLGLEDKFHHRPAQLSGGEMQRVAIARSLINQPVILLADEPTGNLDSKTAAGVFEIFNQLNRDGLTIIVVTHNLEMAKTCGRVVCLEDGKIKEV